MMVSSTFVRGVVGQNMACLFLLILMSAAAIPGEIAERSRVPIIPIICTLERDMFPEEWRADSMQAQAVPLPEAEIDRSYRILTAAMRKYPAAVLKAHIEKIYVVCRLKVGGVLVGGASIGKRIYVVNGGLGRGATDAVIEGAFHHEVAHILLRDCSPKFNVADWERLNPPGFRYRGLNQETFKGYFGRVDHRHLQNGFLDKYALSHWKEDFCIFAQNLFTGKRSFWQIVERYERVKRKMTKVVEFYHEIDPTFTEDYFRRFVKETPEGTEWTIYADA